MMACVRCELFIYEAQSLKDKRSVLQSVLRKVRQRCNVSAAETGYQQTWQRAEFSLCAVAASKKSAEAELLRALAIIDQAEAAERTLTNWEWA
ncbi:MAG: DUF503 domain-containing protein [Shouchella clausii]|jgi:uncharacterized protein